MEPQHWKNPTENNYYKNHILFISQRQIMKILVAVSLPQGKQICTGFYSQHLTLFSMASISTTLQDHHCPVEITTPRGPGGVDSKTVHACWHWIWEEVLHLCAFKVLLQVKLSHLWLPDTLVILPKDLWCTYWLSFPLNSRWSIVITKNISIPLHSGSFKLFLWYCMFIFSFLSTTSTVYKNCIF